MTKYLIIFLIIVIILLSLVYIIGLNRKGKTPPTSPQPVITAGSPTPTSTARFTSPTGLSVISIFPENNSSNTPLEQTIQVTFNERVSTDNVVFFANPAFEHTITANGKTIIITPNKPLLPGITYTFQLIIKAPHTFFGLYSFATLGEKQQFLPDTHPPGLSSDIDAYNLQNYPDIFLGSKVPYQTPEFSIKGGGFKPDPKPQGHYYFKVTLIGEEQIAKEVLSAWLKSLGLNDTQIQGLDFEYQTQ